MKTIKLNGKLVESGLECGVSLNKINIDVNVNKMVIDLSSIEGDVDIIDVFQEDHSGFKYYLKLKNDKLKFFQDEEQSKYLKLQDIYYSKADSILVIFGIIKTRESLRIGMYNDDTVKVMVLLTLTIPQIELERIEENIKIEEAKNIMNRLKNS